MPTDFLLIGDAAKYVGVAAETLRRWDRTGKLVASKRPGSNRRYYARADLEPFRLDYARVVSRTDTQPSVFVTALADIEANNTLRVPQREGHTAARNHFAEQGEAAMLVIPVGCGKTGLISVLPFGISEGRVLVIAPNLTIRDGIAEDLDIADNKCFWAKTRVLSHFQQGPFVAVLDGQDANFQDCLESDFVVTNIQQLVSSADKWLPRFPPDFFDMIIVDEGHHSAAESWRKVLRRFPDAKVVSLTATPFRADRRALPGTEIYRYSFAKAMLKGYITHIGSMSAKPSELYFTATGGRRYTLAEVLELREEAWFRLSVALSPECNRHIVEASIEVCNEMRQENGTPHQIIASALSIDHASQIRSIYEECGYRAGVISSDLDPDKKEQVIHRLRTHQIDCIVQVRMLGEGFDHPPLSVAAIFKPYRSLAPYIQFVGRIMRVIHQNKPDHPDNQGVIVSHVGLNNETRWDDFRELDLDDQNLVREWTAGNNSYQAEDDSSRGGGVPRRFDQLPIVQTEIISAFLHQQFLDPEDDRVLDTILDQTIEPFGIALKTILDRETLREQLRQMQQPPPPTSESIPVSPQRRRREARRRLRERTQSVAARVLDDLGIGPIGRQLSKAAGKGGQPNRQTAIALMHERVNDYIGIDAGMRGELSTGQALDAYEQLDHLGDEIVAKYRPFIDGTG